MFIAKITKMSLLLHLQVINHLLLSFSMCLVYLQTVVSKKTEVVAHQYIPLFEFVKHFYLFNSVPFLFVDVIVITNL